MMVNNPDAADTVAVTHWVPFADWADGRTLLGDRRPTIADLEYHLTTLFPPVRPRQWLEIRYLDSMPDEYWPAVVFTLVALLDDPVAADIAAEAVEPVATAWDIAARLGLRDRRLHAGGQQVRGRRRREGARGARPTRWSGWSAPSNRADVPGTDFSDQVIEHGIAATVSEAAQSTQGGL